MASTQRTLSIEAAIAWKTEWAASPWGDSLRRLWRKPSKAPMQLYQGLQRAATLVFIQIQTGKIALASYLGTFKLMESTECSCGRCPQDLRHILLHCTNQAGPQMHHLTQGPRRGLDYLAYLIRPDLVPKVVRLCLRQAS